MFNLPMFPSYLNLTSQEFDRRINSAYKLLEECCLCHRKCGVDRIKGENGFCKAGVNPKVSSYNLHYGEEPPISGTRGSGTIFFTGCSLACVFCQNYPISQLGVGNEVSIERLAEMMLELQSKGAHNINLVTPTHFIPQFISALKVAKDKGLKLPIVYNTGGYDELVTLKLLEDIIDIYMPDAKYSDNDNALKYSSGIEYVEANRCAIQEMYRQTGDLMVENGIAIRGTLVRVLVLPDDISGSETVLEFLHSISPNMYISLMSQYFPANKASKSLIQGARIPKSYRSRASKYPELSRRITEEEYEKVYNKLMKLGLEGYIQPLG